MMLTNLPCNSTLHEFFEMNKLCESPNDSQYVRTQTFEPEAVQDLQDLQHTTA